MVTVIWNLVDGREGVVQLGDDDRWTLGRAGCDDVTVPIEDAAVSRQAITIRDGAQGPVVFRGQRDNGAGVALVSLLGSQRQIPEGTAVNLTDEENRIEFHLGDVLVATIDVEFEPRPGAVTHLGSEAAPEPGVHGSGG